MRAHSELADEVDIIAHTATHIHQIVDEVDTIVGNDFWLATPEQHATVESNIGTFVALDRGHPARTV